MSGTKSQGYRTINRAPSNTRGFFMKCYCCDTVMTHAPVCCRCRHRLPHFESQTRKYDMRTTRLMSRAHGTYVRSSIVEVANSIYLRVKPARNGKRLGVVEPD